MLIAYATSITLLPALITVLNPQGEPEEIGYRVLAPVDRFLETHRVPVIVGTLAVALLGSPLLYYLTFDFDPIHLRSPKRSRFRLCSTRRRPRVGVNSSTCILPSLDEAEAVAEKLRKLPEVLQASTLSDFVPRDQDKKLAIDPGSAAAAWDSRCSRRHRASRRPMPKMLPRSMAWPTSSTRSPATAAGPGADAAKRLAAMR